MPLFSILAVLVTLSALLSYVNHRTLRLPTTIALMASSMGLSLLVVSLDRFGVGLEHEARALLASIDFDAALLEGMLSYLLFAGALHVDLDRLREHRFIILVLSTAGVATSTLLIGSAMYWVLSALGATVPYAYALVFGALISPTDPIAVLGILKKVGAPKALEVQIAGESLFNDGVGVVVFLVLVNVAQGGDVTASGIASLFLIEAVGGAAFGLVIGSLSYWLIRTVDDYHLEILITLSLVTGGYAAAMALHVSGPIAVVVAGLLVGNQGRARAMSELTRQHLDTFWEIVDEVLNAVLFVLIGLEIVLVEFDPRLTVAGAVAVIVSLGARFLVVGLPVSVLRKFRSLPRGTVRVMTWGGLRGGISVALALSLPESDLRQVLLTITYHVVAFSVIVQGLTVGTVLGRVGLRVEG